MSYILVLEASESQASLLGEDLGRHTGTPITIVATLREAIEAIEDELPRLILANALFPEREEEQLMRCLRAVPGAIAPHVLVVPPLARPSKPEPARKTFDFLKKKAPAWRPGPCDSGDFVRHAMQYLEDPNATGAERRAARRIDRIDWATMTVEGDRVELIDLSLLGAQVRGHLRLTVGQTVRVILSREAESEAVECLAHVAWRVPSPTDDTAGHRAGLRFRRVDYRRLQKLAFGERGIAVRQSPALAS